MSSNSSPIMALKPQRLFLEKNDISFKKITFIHVLLHSQVVQVHFKFLGNILFYVLLEMNFKGNPPSNKSESGLYMPTSIPNSQTCCMLEEISLGMNSSMFANCSVFCDVRSSVLGQNVMFGSVQSSVLLLCNQSRLRTYSLMFANCLVFCDVRHVRSSILGQNVMFGKFDVWSVRSSVFWCSFQD